MSWRPGKVWEHSAGHHLLSRGDGDLPGVGKCCGDGSCAASDGKPPLLARQLRTRASGVCRGAKAVNVVPERGRLRLCPYEPGQCALPSGRCGCRKETVPGSAAALSEGAE